MSRGDRSREKFQELREKAERRLKPGEAGSGQADSEELAHLVHELEVHQVELELQNEELRRARAEIETSRDEYEELYEAAPVGYVTLDPNGLIQKANMAAREILGFEHALSGKAFSTFLLKEDYPAYYAYLNERASQPKQAGAVEVRLTGPGEPRHVRLQATAAFDASRSLTHWRLSLVDVTERKRAEEARFQGAFENAAVGMSQVTPRGDFVRVNQKMCDILGYDKAELLGMRFHDITPPEDLHGEKDLVRRLMQGQIDHYTLEKRLLRKSGDPVWVRVTAAMQSHDLGVGVVEDITQQKAFEEALRQSRDELEERVEQRTVELQAESRRRRHLAGRLVDLLEQDRQKLAMMLHDDVGQTLTGAKMALESLRADMRGQTDGFAERMDPVVESLQGVIASLRDTSRELRPSSLDLLGLVPGLRSLAEGMQSKTRRIYFFFKHVPDALDPGLQLALYRIAQEAVLNAVQHSGCSEIHLSLTTRDHTLHLTVEDNGCGFAWNEVASDPAGRGPLGLTIMRERAFLAGGELRVDSVPGKGTTVAVEVPVQTVSASKGPVPDSQERNRP